MPSLRKKVSSYFRQLSFHNEPREKRFSINENSFVTKYLQGHISIKDGPQILYGKNPTDLPNYDIAQYSTGSDTIVGCYSGPDGGLTTVKRIEKHLSVLDQDIDFIDTQEEQQVAAVKKPRQRQNAGLPLDNSTMIIKVAGQEYCVTNRMKHDSKSHSLDSLTNLNDVKVDITKISTVQTNKNKSDNSVNNNNNNKETNEDETKNDSNKENACVNRKNVEKSDTSYGHRKNSNGYGLAKSKSEGNPFQHKKKGKIIRLSQRPAAIRAGESAEGEENSEGMKNPCDNALPKEWNRKSEYIYGMSDSLYDKNLVTKNMNGDPIADCFGIIARRDSAILALADGVNWGEKASTAAKSAVHGSLHYLNKTIFHDTKPFDGLTVKEENGGGVGGGERSQVPLSSNRINNTREVFVCLLRAFNCAHDLILENKGMLTTLTVAVVLPLKQKNKNSTGNQQETSTVEPLRYVCCVCNVGDTLAYIYSQKYGIREMTKGSHDINCNRDMRDALGALGPVDGIKPELSNLTLSITTMQKGDIVLIASDGLTDNFDPNVCRFTVNSNLTESLRPPKRSEQNKQPPIKPPRKTSSSTKSAENASKEPVPDLNNPLVTEFMRQNSCDKTPKKKTVQVAENRASSLRKQSSSQIRKETVPSQRASSNRNDPRSQPKYNIFRSKTSLDFRATCKQILRNEDGIPYVTPIQRYELTLLLMEDVLKKGISGNESQCTNAKRLCENLLSFTFSITAAKRHTLEDYDLYFDNRNGVMVEVSSHEKKTRRKRGLERVQNLPGKLDHVSVVAYNVGNCSV